MIVGTPRGAFAVVAARCGTLFGSAFGSCPKPNMDIDGRGAWAAAADKNVFWRRAAAVQTAFPASAAVIERPSRDVVRFDVNARAVS